MTDDALREIESRAAAATPGHWHNHSPSLGDCRTIRLGNRDGVTLLVMGPHGREADMEFVAHSRDDVLRLIGEVRELKRQLTITEGFLRARQ